MTTPLNGSITLGQAPGTVDEIVRIADGAPIALEKAALDNMARVSSRIQRAIEQGQVIYGLTTGVGDLVTTRLSPDRMTDTQLNMLRSHACGVGPDLTVREVRAMMAVTLKSLLQGYSGVTPALAQRIADMAGGMCLEAMRGNTRGYDARLHALRPHPGQQETAQNLRRLLKGSEILARYRDHRVQDALSLRCIPQIHGAVRDQLAHCRQIMTIELNSVTDNPLFLVEEDRLIVMPGGNGHGAPTALALDALAVAIAQLSTASQARCDRITNTHLSGLPAFLISPDSGYSGMMIPPYVAAALAGDNRSLAGPASIHTVSTCAGQEDHVSMGVASARKALKAVENAVDIVAIELLCACQALEFHRPLRAAVGSEATLERVRQAVPFRDKDTLLYPDIHALRALIHQGELSAMLQALCEEE